MTKIEWVRADDGSEGLSWNALRAVHIDEAGKRRSANHCEHVNNACKFCYAEPLNARLGGLPFKPGHRKDYTFEIDKRKLLEPLLRKKPTRIFVESMSDAFGEWWPDSFIDKLYAVMALCPQHTFINLTKRPERRRAYLESRSRGIKFWQRSARSFGHSLQWDVPSDLPSPLAGKTVGLCAFPLPNVIEGVSVSCQEEADEFVPILLNTPAAVRCVSAEPLLGRIDFTDIRWPKDRPRFPETDDISDSRSALHLIEKTRINWIIIGGESGPKARPMHPDWARGIRDQCKAAGVAFFFKQWGEWLPGHQYTNVHRELDPDPEQSRFRCMDWDGDETDDPIESDGTWADTCSENACYRVGKKAAGRLLDGREHNEFPRI